MGGVGAIGIYAATGLLGVALLLIGLMMAKAVKEGSLSSQMAHVVPIAMVQVRHPPTSSRGLLPPQYHTPFYPVVDRPTAQFIDFASDVFVLVEFLQSDVAQLGQSAPKSTAAHKISLAVLEPTRLPRGLM